MKRLLIVIQGFDQSSDVVLIRGFESNGHVGLVQLLETKHRRLVRSPYSYLRTAIGSTPAARRAGM